MLVSLSKIKVKRKVRYLLERAALTYESRANKVKKSEFNFIGCTMSWRERETCKSFVPERRTHEIYSFFYPLRYVINGSKLLLTACLVQPLKHGSHRFVAKMHKCALSEC